MSILGEIPVQAAGQQFLSLRRPQEAVDMALKGFKAALKAVNEVRGISPELLTKCLRLMWHLRLGEETYLELFSMEVGALGPPRWAARR